MPDLPDLGMAAFHSDEWRFAAICIIIIGAAVIPTLLWYLHSRRLANQRFKIAFLEAQQKLEQTRNWRKKNKKGGKR